MSKKTINITSKIQKQHLSDVVKYFEEIKILTIDSYMDLDCEITNMIFPDNIKTFHHVFGNNGAIFNSVKAKRFAYNEYEKEKFKIFEKLTDTSRKALIEHYEVVTAELNLMPVGFEERFKKKGYSDKEIAELKMQNNQNLGRLQVSGKDNIYDLFAHNAHTLINQAKSISVSDDGGINLNLLKKQFTSGEGPNITTITNLKAAEYLEQTEFNAGDLIYLCPPEDLEMDLSYKGIAMIFHELDNLHKEDVRFACNVSIVKDGVINHHLMEWVTRRGYKTHCLAYTKSRPHASMSIIITNY